VRAERCEDKNAVSKVITECIALREAGIGNRQQATGNREMGKILEKGSRGAEEQRSRGENYETDHQSPLLTLDCLRAYPQ
jgi:hypothetical protein